MQNILSAAKGPPDALKSALSLHLSEVKHPRYHMKPVSQYPP